MSKTRRLCPEGIDILNTIMSTPSKLFGGGHEQPKSLDFYDNRIDEAGQYQLRYGKFKDLGE